MGLFSNVFDGAAGGAISGIGSIVGGIVGANNAAKINAQNYAAQKEFAQNGIRWRVADAKAAGLHPLAALGASPASYSPASVVGGDYGISDAAQALGQGIDRAQQAKMLKEERLQAQQEQRERNDLYKRLVESQIANMNAQTTSTYAEASYWASREAVANQGLPPSMSSLAPDGSYIDGQGDSTSSSRFKIVPAEITANEPGRKGQEAGSIPDVSFVRTNDGGYSPVRSSAVADRLDDDFIGTSLWHLRNNLPILFGSDRSAPPTSWLPDRGRRSYWSFDFLRGAWYPKYKFTVKHSVGGLRYGRYNTD